jgi:hypothetical protein
MYLLNLVSQPGGVDQTKAISTTISVNINTGCEEFTGPALARSNAIAKYISLIKANFSHKNTCSQPMKR